MASYISNLMQNKYVKRAATTIAGLTMLASIGATSAAAFTGNVSPIKNTPVKPKISSITEYNLSPADKMMLENTDADISKAKQMFEKDAEDINNAKIVPTQYDPNRSINNA